MLSREEEEEEEECSDVKMLLSVCSNMVTLIPLLICVCVCVLYR